MSQTLIREQPDEPVTWFLQAVAFSKLGFELGAAGQTKEAEESFSKALPIFEKAAGHPRFAASAAWLEEQQTYVNRGKLRAQMGRFQEAEADYDQALAVLNKISTAQRFPSFNSDLASVQEELGNVLWAMNRRKDSADAFRRAEEGREQILRSPKRKVVPLSAMARFYATCPDEQFRNKVQAVALAKQAVEERGKSPVHIPRDEGDCWKTLGVAHYRAGDWEHAVAALETAMRLRDGGDGADWLFLAMAHWQQDDKDEARTWYDKAVEWMDKNRPKDEELARFRAEARALLKTEDTPKAKPD
jgi:tetratricopeptide (TPR) repeat protein